MNINELETVEIPLSQLFAWDGNVRNMDSDEPESGEETDIDELAASIAAVGLLSTPVVQKAPRRKYAVIGGGRRLKALKKLAADGTIKPSYPVTCRLAPDHADPVELGLAENLQKPMHPAAQFVAFKRLLDNGKSSADIAASFGVTEAVVSRRLALARVSPFLLAQYRAGEINLDLLQAFIVSTDHAAQEAVWEQTPSYNRHPQTIRRLLLAGDMAATDRLARFVGVPVYEAAGGSVRRDLFAEGEQGVYICDPIKLTQLANEKLAAAAEELKADGWKWVECLTQGIDYSILRRFEKIDARNAPLPEQTKTQLAELERQRDGLRQQIQEAEEIEEIDEAESNPLYGQLQAVEESIETIQRNRPRQYAKRTKARCGVCVGISGNGDFEFVYGLMRKEDRPTVEGDESSNSDQDAESPETTPIQQPSDDEGNLSPAYSAALMVSLTQEKTAAIAAELTQQPRIALAAVVYTFVLSQFRLDLDFYRSYSSLRLTMQQARLDGAASSRAVEQLAAQRQNLPEAFL
jgi:ParB family transcriptional regulator, chromosome partitioning protein